MIYIGVGSNLGKREENITGAINLLCNEGDIQLLAVSALYETTPVGVTEQPLFLNAVVALTTNLSAHALLERCMKVEQSFKRLRKIRWGPRTIDLDILLFKKLTFDDKQLILPHPRMEERLFVLVPLAEIAPNVLVKGVRVLDLLNLHLKDQPETGQRVVLYKHLSLQGGRVAVE